MQSETDKRDGERTGKGVMGRRALLSMVGLGAIAATDVIPSPLGMGAHGVQITGTLPWQDGMADQPTDSVKAGTSFLTAAELAFVTAAADRLIPPDGTGPSASQAGVPTFIDRQLAGPWGRGDHLYLGGPWPKGTPSQGFQSRLAPAEYYRTSIGAIETHVNHQYGKNFDTLTGQQQDSLLGQLEAGKMDLNGVDAREFFAMLWQNVKEGFFADPIYGGNRDLAAWKMIGFPGARYDYTDWITRHGERVPYEPVGLLGRAGWHGKA